MILGVTGDCWKFVVFRAFGGHFWRMLAPIGSVFVARAPFWTPFGPLGLSFRKQGGHMAILTESGPPKGGNWGAHGIPKLAQIGYPEL